MEIENIIEKYNNMRLAQIKASSKWIAKNKDKACGCSKTYYHKHKHEEELSF